MKKINKIENKYKLRQKHVLNYIAVHNKLLRLKIVLIIFKLTTHRNFDF